MYTVKQLADLAGVSVRTLHYYDEIGLLKPAEVGANGYRYYDEAAVFRLQQILFYREIGLELLQIRDILDDPTFDLATALRAHRQALEARISRLQGLVSTVDSTLRHLAGEVTMSRKQLFEAFSDEQQKQYEREARLQYGPDNVNESIRRWKSYTTAQRQAIGEEGNRIYSEIVDAIEAGLPPDSDVVQAVLVRWHNHIRYFYEPTLDILRGLGDLYNDNPDFAANFRKVHPELASYMREAIVQYVDDLETALLEAMLAEDRKRAEDE
jgi:DNA-binding transcriptional MerR regulator